MTSENMMAELRRIVGECAEERASEIVKRAKVCTGRFESDRAAQAAAIFGACSCGREGGIGFVLAKLSQAFGLDLSAYAVSEKDIKKASEARAEGAAGTI